MTRPIQEQHFLAWCVVALILGGSIMAGGARSDGDEALLKQHNVNPDAEGVLNFIRSRTLGDKDREQLERLIKQLGDRRFVERERAEKALLHRGPVAVPYLKDALKGKDTEVVRRAERILLQIDRGPGAALPAAAVRVLVRLKPAGAAAALLQYIPFADNEYVEEEVLTGLLALHASQQRIEPILLQALADPLPMRRAAAVHVLGRLKEQQTAVRKLLADPDGRVRFRAAERLVMGQDREAITVLIDLLADVPPALSWRAEDLLLRIAGDKAPNLSAGAGNPAARKEYKAAWTAWWREHGRSVDLARLQKVPPYLGLTVIAQRDAGKVWECGPDGKPRWIITGLQGPMDVQVLPGGRVLIAEYDGKKVTERDLHGKVVWEKALDQSPNSCRRLPNGDTFIATYTNVLEVTRDGKEIYNHNVKSRGISPGHGIYAAQKLADGRVVALTRRGTIFEIDPIVGKAIRTLHVGSQGASSVEALTGGRFLVAHSSHGTVVEYDPEGKSLWTHALPGAFHATRLPNGNTLISTAQGRVIEVNREGKTAWEQSTGSGASRVHRR